MTNPTGFLDIARRDRPCRPVSARLKDWREFIEPLPELELRRQSERCMDCGVPFCHTACPVENLIPDWNDLVSEGRWREALDRLHRTNNFPEFTGRICPAPCEAACTLNIDDAPVTIKTIECAIADRGWQEGWIAPLPALRRSGRRVAVIGSGPAGLACAQQLARAGHSPTVFEKADRIGGLLRYGIPDFKLDRALIDRRVAQMEAEGVVFRTRIDVGGALPIEDVLDEHEAVVLAVGAEQPRDLDVPGRDLGGVHFAMDYLVQQNRRNAGLPDLGIPIEAEGRHVVVLGGGDTGSDCIGTANRQHAASVTQLEILPQPPFAENKALSWPRWPLRLRTSAAHEEGASREFAVTTLRLDGEEGRVTALHCERDGGPITFKADLVLLALGFTGPRTGGVVDQLAAEIPVAGYETSRPGVFACGDSRRGQSLVVWAIREGRECAAAINAHFDRRPTMSGHSG